MQGLYCSRIVKKMGRGNICKGCANKGLDIMDSRRDRKRGLVDRLSWSWIEPVY
jgi:hypothetical protein